MAFPVQIEVKKEPDFDMTVECIIDDAPFVKQVAAKASFDLKVFDRKSGSTSIAESIIYNVTGGTFEDFTSALRTEIEATGQQFSEDEFTSEVNGKHIVFNFDNRDLMQTK